MTASSNDLTSVLANATETQIKIQGAIAAARKSRQDAEKHNATQRAVANRLVSEIQANLNKQIQDSQKAMNETYKQNMVELGLSAEVYPMETAALALDKLAITPVLSASGKGVGSIVGIAKGIGSRFSLGFKAATK